jgi:hypothetical protein
MADLKLSFPESMGEDAKAAVRPRWLSWMMAQVSWVECTGKIPVNLNLKIDC